jgi:hypothetical protein
VLDRDALLAIIRSPNYRLHHGSRTEVVVNAIGDDAAAGAASPLIELAGSTQIGDAIFNEIFHPISRTLVARCDACLRIGGPSRGADEMVALARSLGKQVFLRYADVPGCA